MVYNDGKTLLRVTVGSTGCPWMALARASSIVLERLEIIKMLESAINN